MTNKQLIVSGLFVKMLCFLMIPFLNRLMQLELGEDLFDIKQGVGSSGSFSMKTENLGSEYQFTYNFRDQQGNPTTWKWTYDKNKIDELGSQFGVPLDFYEPYIVTDEVLAEREKIMKESLFHEDGDYILPHYPAIVNAHKDFGKKIYDLAEAHLGDKAAFHSRIELIMRFCQDITYRIPPQKWNGKIISGIFPPSISLKEGWGDCDTKAMILSSILANNPNYKIIAVTVPGHLFLAVKGVPQAYQNTVSYKGEEYIICEPVGPARLELGKKSVYASAPVKRIDEVTGESTGSVQ
jgi:hypothetical protein